MRNCELFFDALGFLTIFPSPGSRINSRESLVKSTIFFPAVGAILGLILAGTNFLLAPYLNHQIINVILIVSLIILTRGIHLDGLADTFDGLLGGKDKAQIIKIMSDSSIGTFGIVALICALLSKFALLNSLPKEVKNIGLILTPTYGRWSAVYQAKFYPWAKEEGLGQVFAKEVKTTHFIFASLTVIVLTAAFLKLQVFYLFLGVVVFTVFVSQLLTRKIEGVTGDTLGATIEITEVWTLLLFSVVSKF